jgi:GAF domain-containing protein
VENINASRDLKQLMKTIVTNISQQPGCTHCTLFLPGKEEGKIVLVPKETSGKKKKFIMKRRFKPGEGLAGWVFQHGQAIMLGDAAKDPRFSPPTVQNKPHRSMLVVPIKVGNRTIGVISTDQDIKNWFNEGHLHKVSDLVRPLGVTIERGIGQSILPEISKQIISETDENIILQRFISGVINLTNTRTGIIHLIGDDERSIVRSYPYPTQFAPLAPRMSKKDGVTRQVIETGQTFKFPDVTEDKRVDPKLHKYIRSMIAVPMKIEQKVMAVLFLHDKKPRSFSETECLLLETLANQAAIAIKNARLSKQIRTRHDKQIKAVHQICKSIVNPTNIGDVLDGIMASVLTLWERLNYCEICLFYKEKEKLISVAERGIIMRHEYREIAVGEGIVGWVAQNKRSQLIMDVSRDSRFLEVLDRGKNGSEIAVPMLKGDELIGVLNIEHPQKNAFNKTDLALAEAIAELAAVAIVNAGDMLELFDRTG